MKTKFENPGTLACALFAIMCLNSCQKENAISKQQTVTAENTSEAVLRASLIAWYPFNGDDQDHSLYGNNVDFNSATATAGRDGTPNSAYYFDGSSSYMTVPNSTSLNPKKITIATLFKPTGVYLGTGNTSRILMKGTDDQSNGVYFLGYYSNGVAYGTYGNNQFESNGVGSPEGSLRPNRWYKLVYTYDGAVGKLYINGILVNESDKKASFTPNSDLLRIGTTGRSDYPYWFKGIIDEIRIYNQAYSPSELSALSKDLGD